MLSTDELHAIRRMIASSGLIKVFDGAQYLDLRRVMDAVIDDTLTLHGQVEHLSGVIRDLTADPGDAE